MKILITGGSGFIGKNLIKELQDKHDVYYPESNELDLTDPDAVNVYFRDKYFDVVIHCAIKGGSRLQPDTPTTMYQNLSMFFHLMENRDRFGKFFNFASGAEYDRRKGVYPKSYNRGIENSFPIDYYGMSKNIISRILKNDKRAYNFRIYGVFGVDESDTRFIKSSLLKIKQNLPIEIHQDKFMDFISIEDLISVLKCYLSDSHSLDNEIDLVYSHKYTLSELARIIKQITKSQTNINIIDNEKYGSSYIGSQTGIDNISVFGVKGLEAGIEKMWNEL